MIQFNLLPDVKLEYIRAKRRKRLVMVSASTVAALSLSLLVVLFFVVNVVQKQHLNNLSNNIDESVKKLQETENLDGILTVQNQLMSLEGLHDQKPVTSRIFDILSQITPLEVTISKLDIDFAQKTMKITGGGASLGDINKFVDTLKFTNYKYPVEEGEPIVERAFSNVVLTSFSRSDSSANFTIDLIYDEIIFDSSKEVELIVPDTITTRSETEKPLFKEIEGEQ